MGLLAFAFTIVFVWTGPQGQNCKFFKTPLSSNSQKRLEHKENQTNQKASESYWNFSISNVGFSSKVTSEQYTKGDETRVFSRGMPCSQLEMESLLKGKISPRLRAVSLFFRFIEGLHTRASVERRSCDTRETRALRGYFRVSRVSLEKRGTAHSLHLTSFAKLSWRRHSLGYKKAYHYFILS